MSKNHGKNPLRGMSQQQIADLFEQIDSGLFPDGKWPAICYGCPANMDGMCELSRSALPEGGNCNLDEETYRRGMERY